MEKKKMKKREISIAGHSLTFYFRAKKIDVVRAVSDGYAGVGASLANQKTNVVILVSEIAVDDELIILNFGSVERINIGNYNNHAKRAEHIAELIDGNIIAHIEDDAEEGNKITIMVTSRGKQSILLTAIKRLGGK